MANSSPESEFGGFECFQNYTAPEVFVQGLAGQINQEDVESIIRAQKLMLQRFEKTNEMLSNCNLLSNSRFILAQKELKKHTTLMHDMKKDLDHIFKRIRNIKTKLSTQYPEQYNASLDNVKPNVSPEEEEESPGTLNSQLERIAADEIVNNSSSCDSISSAKIISTSSSDT